MFRVFMVFSAMLLVLMLLLYVFFTELSKDTIQEQTGRHIITVMEMSDDQLSDRMDVLYEAMLKVMVDTKLYDKMETLKIQGEFGHAVSYEDIRKQLNQTFYPLDGLSSAQILYNGFVVTDRYRMEHELWADGMKWSFHESEAWKRIQDAQGGVVWISPDEVAPEYMQDPDDGGFIWLARVLNMTDLVNIKQAFSGEDSKPVLIVSIQPKEFCEQILQNVSISGAECFMLNENAEPFVNLQETEVCPGHLTEAVRSSAGSGIWSDGDNLYYFIRSGFTGWYFVVRLERAMLLGEMIDEMTGYTLTVSALLLAGMLFVAALFSRSISKPVKKLVAAARKMENGEFGGVIEYDSPTEMGYLVEQFNRMNLSIQRLIEENYQVRLREKDTEIMSLTIQFNPHYLFNTLNAIYWVALRGDVRETAHMVHDLAQMMRYTSDQKQECTCLRDDVEWMKRYFYLMEYRYGDLYTVEWDVDEKLMDMLVPKLFLQPLVENSIIHGFRNIETGGIIRIEGRDCGDGLEFFVSDNGCGMSQEMIDTWMQDENASRVGLANVSRRIQLICGLGYGLSIESKENCGTRIRVKISKNSAMK